MFVIERAFILAQCVVVVFTGALIPLVADSGTMASSKIAARDIIAGVLSRDCETRYEAVSSFLRNMDVGQLSSVQKEIERKSHRAAAYLREAFKVVEAQDQASHRTQELVKKGLAEAVEQVPDTPENQPKIAAFLSSFFVSKVESESPVNQAFLIGYLASQAKHYSPGEESRPFLSAVKDFLDGPNHDVRILAAASLVRAELESTDSLIPVLLEGLRSDEVTVSYFAQEALRQLTKQKICFNPFDPPQQKLRGVAAWEKWYQHFKAKKNGESNANKP